MSNFQRGRHLRIRTVAAFLFTISIAALFTGCTDSGSVGGGIAGPDTEVKFDTLKITNLKTDTLLAYSGNLDFFSAGRFKDQLFGNITATGLFKPLLAPNGDSLAIDEKTNIFLMLAVAPKTEYGDTLASEKFALLEARELWRANQWRIHDKIQTSTTPLVNFSVGSKDTIKVSLPRKWTNKYAKYFNSTENNRDSTYVREFFGLVLKPQNDNKIVTVNPFNTTFVATNVDVIDPESVTVDSTRLDSLTFGMREWAFRIKRTNINSSPKSSSKLISSYERVVRFDFDFNFKKIKTQDIAKVELIFYVDKTLLDQSINQAGPSAARPAADTLNLHYIEGNELPQSVSSGPPLAQAKYNKEDQAYHFNVTRSVVSGFFKATNDQRIFYLTIGKNDGVIRSGLIFNSLTTGKVPKVVISYVENEN